MEEKTELRQTEERGRRKVARWIILCVAILIIGMGAFYIHSIVNRPETFFEPTVDMTKEPAVTITPAFDIQQYLPTEAPTATATAAMAIAIPESTPEQTPEATPAPTTEPAGEPAATADPTTTQEPALSGIVNIALFGIDSREDGSTTSGTMPHTDVNMVLAINFDTKEVSLISLARDVLTTAPGYSGFYKFNGVFNVGGGMEDPKAGFELSRRALEEWMGGVSIPYYYGVDFQAVIDLVDAIGGVDFDVDITLYGMDKQVLAGPGYQHLDGERVLAYLRARKTAGGLDYMRTARQRKMLVAIFQKLKEEGKLSMIPELLRTMGDNLYTNTTLEQAAALVSVARGIDLDNIRTYSIYGDMAEQYLWRYSMIDQQKRLAILKEVYGIDATPMAVDTRRYERFLYEGGFMAIQHVNIAKKLFEEINAAFPEASMSQEQKRAYADCWVKLSDLDTAFEEANRWILTFWDDSVEFSNDEKQQLATYYRTLATLEHQLKESAETMKKAFDLETETNWNRSIDDWFGKGSVINEVYVDFR